VSKYDDLVVWSVVQAETLLSPLGNRWLHVQGVAERARWIGQTFDEDERAYLLAAAYMHDIGYAPALKRTGFHPVDGAYYLRSCGYERLACLVAHHFAARFEAELRGCGAALKEFPREHSAAADALTYCDSTTGPVGQHVTLKERAAEIRHRYKDSDLVVQALKLAMPHVSLTVARTQQRLIKYGLVTSQPRG
jgi:HD superfamily phosphodiesterase